MDWANAIGTSDVFLEFQEKLAALAVFERPLVVAGERGTGKEMAVQRLHYLSARWDKPLLTVLCPALSPSLLESELFGHEAGAFTGARGRHQGYFERADKGTLFLDEVADMPLPLQDRLLRVLEYGAFERVGGSAPVRVDVRVVAATNKDLPALAARGLFRPDLLDRLACDVVHVPPLRARGEDKILLARHFAARMAAELGLAAESPVLGERALARLGEGGYDWPGNVRELKNVVERSVARRRGVVLDDLDLNPFAAPGWPMQPAPPVQAGEAAPASAGAFSAMPASFAPSASSAPSAPSTPCAPASGALLGPDFCLRDAVDKLERDALAEALTLARHRQTEAARLLGLGYHQFRALYRKHFKGAGTPTGKNSTDA